MQHVIVADTKRLCRICMADDPEHPVGLYDVTSVGQLSLHEMLQTICAPVFAKSGPEDVMPEMPTQVCPACQNAIVAAYNLHQQCIETDRRLGELLALMWELQEPRGKVYVEEVGDRTASSSTEEPLAMSADTEDEIPKGDNTCLECGKTFATRWTLIRHKREDWCDKTNDPKQRTCEICKKVLKTVQLLKRHREMHDDPSSALELTSTAQEHASNENTDNVEMLKVEALDLMDEHENEDSLLEEVQNQYTECSTCGISFSSIRAHRMHTQEGNCQRTKTYPCKICGKVFDKASRRQYHMYSHRERVACSRCDETFKNKNGLMVHIRRKRCPANKLGTTQFVPEAEVESQIEDREHPDEPEQMQVKEDDAEEETNDSLDGATQASEVDSSAEKTDSVDIKCTDCGVSFLSARTHKEHTQEGNCQQKPTFPCKICGKIFDKLTRMTYHYYTHKERIPCPMCNEMFRCEGSLQKHLNRKNSAGEKVSCSSQMPEDGLNEPLIEQALVTSSEAFRDPLMSSDALAVVKVEEPEIEETKLEGEIIVEQIVVTDARKTCKICSETFERMATFRFHMRRNHKLYVCGKCNEMFESEPILADHRKTNHAVVTVNCLKCDKSFESQRALQRHRKDGSCLQEAEQTPKPFPCDLCEKSFDSAVKLGYHKVNHGNRIYCDKCGKCLKSKSVLQAHIANGKCLGDKARTCLVCKKVFETLVEYKKHRQEAHSGPVVCPDCGRKLTTFDSLYAHVKDGRCENIRSRSAPGVFARTCKVCGEVQASVSQLKTHMKAKHLDKIYPCASCLLHFPTQKKFDAHMEKHKQNLVNVCQTCNTSFPTMKALKTHKFTHRTRVTCAICEKDYRCESDLRVHMTIHTGEKLHTCDFCPMRFRTKFKKNYHMRIHSTEPKEQTPVVCEHCGSKYTSPYSLKMHIKAAHEGIRPHACTQCDLKFARSSQLSRHKLTHTKERPFKCAVCPQAYLECSELVKHVAREHGDGNAYACDRCDKSFRFIAELRKHYVEHAQEGFDSAGTQEVRFNSLALLNMRFAKEKQQQRAEEGEDSE